MIDSIIAAQLRSAKRVVVPDFGSFIHKEGGQTVFAEFLKKDDGVLIALLGREFGLESAEAHEVIAEYAANVRRTVEANNRYVVSGVGVLHADANGLLVLDAAATEPIVPVAAPVSTPRIEVSAPVEPVVEPTVEPFIEPVSAPRIEVYSPVTPVVEPIATPVVQSIIEPVADVAAVSAPEPFIPEPLPTIDPQWESSTVYKAAAPAEPRHEPTVAFEPVATFEPRHEPTTPYEQRHEPTIEPASGSLRDYIEEQTHRESSRETSREPAARAGQEPAAKRAFTLNDLYGAPEPAEYNTPADLTVPEHTDYGAPEAVCDAPRTNYGAQHADSVADYDTPHLGNPLADYAHHTPSDNNSPTFADFSAPQRETERQAGRQERPTNSDMTRQLAAERPTNSDMTRQSAAERPTTSHTGRSAMGGGRLAENSVMGNNEIDSVLRPPQIRRPEKPGARGSSSGYGAGRGDGRGNGNPRKRRPDVVLIIAVVAAAVALTFMIWGLSNNNAALVRRSTGNGADTRIDSSSVVGGAPTEEAARTLVPAVDAPPQDAPIAE